MSILFIFLASNLDTTSETKNVPSAAIIYVVMFICTPKSYPSSRHALNNHEVK